MSYSPSTTSFPTSLDTPENPTAASDTSDFDHAGLETFQNSAITGLQTAVGITSSAATGSLNYKLTNTSSSNPGHKHTLANGATDVTASATEVNYTDGVTSAIQTQLDNKVDDQAVATYTPAAAGTSTLDISTSPIHSITMPAGNITIAISNETSKKVFLIEITQDGTGSRTVTWFTTIKWAGGSAPTLTTSGGKRDVFGFRVTAADQYDGYVVGQNI